MLKPVVHYDPYEGAHIKVGSPALVVSLDHYSEFVTNGNTTRTSKVISYDEDSGVFETENTIYKPEAAQ